MASKTLPLDLSTYPKLTTQQVGHLRHFHNLAFQPDGEWYHMGSQEPAQEFLDAYRYQLATMAYGAGVTHYHRMPALRCIFKPLLRRLIHKMLHRSVWGYWFNTSHGGKMTDPSLEKLREPCADPIVRENIMYSGHLLLMTSLYAMLFDDDEFERPGSMVSDWNPIFWGMGPEKFTYNNASLQKAIIAEMERNGWIGVCCEPNLVFVVCNQFPLIAMRYNDVRNGTKTIDEILGKYKAAWDAKGLVTKDGLFPEWWMVKQDHVLAAQDVSFTAWAAAFMNTWNHDLVQSLFAKQSLGFITNVNGQIRLQPNPVANAYRRHAELIKDANDDSTSSKEKLLSQAMSEAKLSLASPDKPKPRISYAKPTFGYVVKWLSELGKATELNGLLDYADKKLNPTWEHGGLYYPRNDTPFDADLEWTHMDPFSGNSAIGYARLNIEDGQRLMWEKPWTGETLQSKPWIDNLDFVKPASGAATLRGIWDEDAGALIVTVKAWDFDHRSCDDSVTIEPIARNLRKGHYAIYVRNKLEREQELHDDGELSVSVRLSRSEEVDVVFLRL